MPFLVYLVYQRPGPLKHLPVPQTKTQRSPSIISLKENFCLWPFQQLRWPMSTGLLNRDLEQQKVSTAWRFCPSLILLVNSGVKTLDLAFPKLWWNPSCHLLPCFFISPGLYSPSSEAGDINATGHESILWIVKQGISNYVECGSCWRRVFDECPPPGPYCRWVVLTCLSSNPWAYLPCLNQH